MNPLPMKDQNKQKINQAHDAYGKASLSRKEVAIDFLKGHLPKELVEMIDLDSLELTKGSFVDSLFQFHNDIHSKTLPVEYDCQHIFEMPGVSNEKPNISFEIPNISIENLGLD